MSLFEKAIQPKMRKILSVPDRVQAASFLIALAVFAFLVTGCDATPAPHIPATETSTLTATAMPALTSTLTLTPTNTTAPTSTPTFTPFPTETHTPTPVPTYTTLRGKVLVERLSCRFGPGAMYLFKYSVFQDTVLEIIGRMEKSSWILVQAVGGSNPCWVNGSDEYMEVRGDIKAVAPVDPHKILAWSPYYDALTGVSAQRDGEVVTVFWNQLVLRAGDSSEQVPYVVEAWVCRDGEIVFAPVGAYALAAEVIDEPGCVEPAYVRVMGAEKHGYTQWRVVDWPQVNIGPTPTPPN